jgi:DNA-binding beta-propeller fold protein YncE
MTARARDAARGAPRQRRRTSFALGALLWLLLGWLAPMPAAHADGGAPNLAYVVSRAATGNGGSLAVIDVAQRKLAWQVPLAAAPNAVQLSADGRTVYVAESGANGVVLLDARSHRVTAALRTGAAGDLALDISVTGALFASNGATGRLAVVDPARARVTASIPVGMGAAGLAVAGPGSDSANAQDTEIYVAHPEANSVTIVSATHHTVLSTVTIPGGPQAVVAPGTGGLAYVATRAGTVELIGLTDHQRHGTVYSAPGDEFGRMDYDAVTGEIYLADVTRDQVVALAPASLGGDSGAARVPAEPARMTPIAGGPSAVAITFDGAFGFVTQREAGSVTMLDLAAHQSLATIAVEGQPVAVITGAYPPALDARTADVVGMLLYVLAGVSALAVAGYFFGWFGAARRWLNAWIGRSRSA